MSSPERKPHRKRTLAREIAMQLLYQHDIRRRSAREAGEGSPAPEDERRLAEEWITEASDDPEVREFARTLYYGAHDAIESSDALVADVADNWKPDRIAAIDRAILRLAIFELSELTEVPPKVTLNEAIELAKRFSTAQSGSFINGILDRLLYLRTED